MTFPELSLIQVEYQGEPVPFCLPRLSFVEAEYRGNQVPYALPQLPSVELEYQGHRAPYALPRLGSFQLEYFSRPLTTGIKIAGAVVTSFSLASVVNTPLATEIKASDLLEFSEVTSNASFDSEDKWSHLVMVFWNESSGQMKNIVHVKIAGKWVGHVTFDSNTATGTWIMRSIIIHGTEGNELILLPSVVRSQVVISA